MSEWSAFIVPSNEAERTPVAPEDWAGYQAQREAILAFSKEARDGQQ